MPDAPDTVTHEVVVLGGTNVDIKSRSAAPLVAGTSNPGRTRVGAGGVGRNVAEALARLGVRTLLVSVVGDDALGADVLATSAAAGVDVGGVRVVAGAATGSYHAVLDASGDLAVAVSDMALVDALDATIVHDHAPSIAAASLLVLDANLSHTVLVAALEVAVQHDVPVAVEPVSVAKASRLAEVLDPSRPIALLTPNADELSALVDEPVARDDLDALAAAGARLHQRGVRVVSVRLGARGTFVSVALGATRLVGTKAVRDVVDVTGAGDAALAGHLWAALHRGADPFTAARAGNATALAVLRGGGIAQAALRPARIDALVTELEEHP